MKDAIRQLVKVLKDYNILSSCTWHEDLKENHQNIFWFSDDPSYVWDIRFNNPLQLIVRLFPPTFSCTLDLSHCMTKFSVEWEKRFPLAHNSLSNIPGYKFVQDFKEFLEAVGKVPSDALLMNCYEQGIIKTKFLSSFSYAKSNALDFPTVPEDITNMPHVLFPKCKHDKFFNYSVLLCCDMNKGRYLVNSSQVLNILGCYLVSSAKFIVSSFKNPFKLSEEIKQEVMRAYEKVQKFLVIKGGE